ncbi:8242_t:CDS:2, partial [Entrophospora sp. SA101]
QKYHCLFNNNKIVGSKSLENYPRFKKKVEFPSILIRNNNFVIDSAGHHHNIIRFITTKNFKSIIEISSSSSPLNKKIMAFIDITSEAPSQLFRRRNALSPWVEFNKALFDDPVFRQTGDYKNSPLNQVYYDSMAMVQRGYENNYKNLKTSFDGYITNSGGITFTALDSMYTSSLIGKNYKQDMINIKYWAASKANNDKARIQVTGAVKDNNTILEKITIYWPNTNKEILLHSEDINNIPPFEKSNDQDESPPIIE